MNYLLWISLDDDYIEFYSDLQDNDPDYVNRLNAFSQINCDALNTGTIEGADLVIGGKNINQIFVRKIKISHNL